MACRRGSPPTPAPRHHHRRLQQRPPRRHLHLRTAWVSTASSPSLALPPRGCCGTCISRCFLFLFFAIVICQHQMGVCTLWVICFVVLFSVSVLVSVWVFVCACRSRWSPCMSHEALSGHVCKLPSFLPSKARA